MFGWTVEELCGKSRRRPLVTARQIGMYVIRELTDFSYPPIAEAFGGRDHTTVMHAVDKIKQQMTERHAIFDQVNELIGRIQARQQWITLWIAGDCVVARGDAAGHPRRPWHERSRGGRRCIAGSTGGQRGQAVHPQSTA